MCRNWYDRFNRIEEKFVQNIIKLAQLIMMLIDLPDNRRIWLIVSNRNNRH